MATVTPVTDTATNEDMGAHYRGYFTSDPKTFAYIERARERAQKEALTVARGKLKDGKGCALVSSASEPNKWHVVSAWRLAGVRYYICDCKGMDPHSDKSYTGYVTCKHAEKVRATYGG